MSTGLLPDQNCEVKMSSPSANTVTLLLRGVLGRRIRRGSWAYILWLLAYLPFMIWSADFVFVHPCSSQFLLLLIPFGAVLVQIAYPTWLGWAVFVIPSVFVAGGGMFFVVLTAPRKVQDDLAGFVGSSVATGFYVLVGVALWFARPKRVEPVVVEPVAPASGGQRTRSPWQVQGW
jgi:hypothetical protein